MNLEAHEPSPRLPNKLVVTLKAGGYFFALANIVCVAILAWAFLSVKLAPKTLAVTGSARKAIVSDLVTWNGTITASDADLVKAYDALKRDADKVRAFLLAAGLPDSAVTLSAIAIAANLLARAASGLGETPSQITSRASSCPMETVVGSQCGCW